ncbi:MAG: hypothetical protein JRH08_00870 [Deltaproteobacteria bacterium]|nr:hypothetical protein [Deltaproteobacteria bacterium]MBW2025715.1 hypothetical protein [Deltaproteobacteria bacterium]MBW2124256.1 hypothetical protein [Deltaproteobacteria bacterium]
MSPYYDYALSTEGLEPEPGPHFSGADEVAAHQAENLRRAIGDELWEWLCEMERKMEKKELEECIQAVRAVKEAQKKADEKIKQTFYGGRKIYFFTPSTMRRAAPARVEWARVIQARPEIRIRNLRTGKDRTIHLDDVIDEPHNGQP